MFEFYFCHVLEIVIKCIILKQEDHFIVVLQALRLHPSGMQHNAIIVIVTAIIMQNQEDS
jgi:hypothetical protein